MGAEMDNQLTRITTGILTDLTPRKKVGNGKVIFSNLSHADFSSLRLDNIG